MHYALDRTKFALEGDIFQYQIDSRGSTFKVRAFATGLLSAFGHSPTIAIREFSGTARFDPETLDSASLELRIQAASLTVADDISDKDRREIERQMFEDVLEIAKYPEITYQAQSASITELANGQMEINLQGSLTLHGVTQPQTVTGRLTLMGDSLRAFGEFSISMSAYGIKPATAVAGTIKLKDELKATFDLLARKQI